MDIKKSAKAYDRFVNKYTFDKHVIDRPSFSFTETAPIGTTPSLPNQIIPHISFIFYNHPNKTFYFLGNAKVPKLSVDVVMCRRQIY